MKRSAILFFFASLILCLSTYVYAQEANKEADNYLEEITGRYFKDRKYNECVEYLKSLEQKKIESEAAVNYFIALARYEQLKYLEESQGWNEYFTSGKDYRSELVSAGQKALDKTTAQESVNIYAKLLLWKSHKDQEDGLAESALSALMEGVLEYSRDAKNITPIKDVADGLLSYEEKAKAHQLYGIYADKIVAQTAKDEDLQGKAEDSYKEGNLQLAQELYNAYIERSAKSQNKEKLLPGLLNIARQFSYKSTGPKDLFYAEEVFKKIEKIAGREVFDEESLYLRASNLEQAKEYAFAKDAYLDLISRYPKSIYSDEVNYKLGIIYTYILRDIESGEGYFKKVISGLYQLGLLSQWANDTLKAKEYYNKLIEESGGNFTEKIELCRERLREIDDRKPLEYNLKMFLDASLKQENIMFDRGKLDLRITPYAAKTGEKVNVNSNLAAHQTGCMQVELEYLWSGDLGSARPAAKSTKFDTDYQDKGIKQINLVVVSPAGVIDYNIDLLNVN